MSRALAWPLALPLVVVAALAGHDAGYWLAAPDAHARRHLLDGTGHAAYWEWAPLAAALLVGLALAGAVLVASCALRRRSLPAVQARVLAALPLVVFCVQEHAERLLHGGTFPWAALLEPAVLAGLLLQLPFALAALALARALESLALEVAAALALPRPRLASLASALVPVPPAVAVPAVAARGYGLRGPPVHR